MLPCQVEWAGVNFVDTYHRCCIAGIKFPYADCIVHQVRPLSKQTTSPPYCQGGIWNHFRTTFGPICPRELRFQGSGFQERGPRCTREFSHIIPGSAFLFFLSTPTLVRIILAHSRSMLRSTGTRLSMLYQTRFPLVSLQPRSFKASRLSYK